MRKYRIQLIDAITRKAIEEAGGKAYVAVNGGTLKVATLTAAGAALTNPVALTNGVLEFYTADETSTVDLYVQAPSGHFVVMKDVVASGPNDLYIDKGRAETTLVIPVNVADQTGDATETQTGFTLAGAVAPHVAFDVVTVDATETVDIGTLSSDSGDADGFIDGVSVATAGLIKATAATGAVTLGALLYVQDSANAGDKFPEMNTTMIGKEVTYTFSAGADTAEGFIIIPQVLRAAAL